MSWCWWCCHDFTTEPLSMPLKYNDRTNKFVTSGRFCSWSCMKAYAINEFGISRGGIVCGNIVMMRKQLYNKRGSIHCAPKRQTLKEFGGNLSIEEFRKNMIIDTKPVNKIIEEPETNIVVPVTTNTNKMYEIKGATGTNEPLRLKRAKPLKRDKNNLESVLGLVIKPKKTDN